MPSASTLPGVADPTVGAGWLSRPGLWGVLGLQVEPQAGQAGVDQGAGQAREATGHVTVLLVAARALEDVVEQVPPPGRVRI